jgi:hypothetical protein
MLPQAIVSHQTAERLRIKIPSRKGDGAFFSSVKHSLDRDMKYDLVNVNALTGSVLIVDSGVEVEALANCASQEHLFTLEHRLVPVQPLGRTLFAPVLDLNRKISGFTDGAVDFPGLIFLALCGFGIYEILRGNFRPPPWYTAFWYAFGIFTKSMVDRARSEK